ncbi:MAG TPA: NUDIX hydrolase [Pseudolabrys sp.]|jgi:8-oxo-dGTP pyrophosphatase MutT (NUDIX family)|nr:NUDIX hydrolase [Pseudolabrys sp.]
MVASPTIVRCSRLELTVSFKRWDFAEERKREIAARFAQMQRERPELWNGRVLMLQAYEIVGDVFRGAFFETDYASFRTWHQLGCPGAPVYDCFGAAAVLSADNAFILGIMAEHTANAGRIYFPCGTPDPQDVVDGRVDFDFSIRRELNEETGLDAAELDEEPGWTTVIAGPFIAQIKVLRSVENATRLQTRIGEFLRRGRSPELAGIVLARSSADTNPAMPEFVTAFLRHRWSAGA